MAVTDFEKTFLNKDSAEATELLSIALEQGEFEKFRISQYVMALEEALMVWRENFPEDTEIKFSRVRHTNTSELFATLEGTKVDPLVTPDDIDDYVMLRKRILAGCGVEFSYSYKDGTNILRLRFPHKKTEKRIFLWNLLAVGIPIVLQMFLMSAINATDGFMLGFLNQDALSAVSLSNNFANIFSIATSSMGVGLSILISQYWGKRDREAVNDILALAIKAEFVVALLFFLSALIFPNKIMSFYTNDAQLISMGTTYLRIIALAFLIDSIGEVYACIMVNIGHVVRSTFFSITSALLNVVLNALLIFGLLGLPKLGIVGAAIASVISVLVKTILYISEMIKDGFAQGLLNRLLTIKSRFMQLFVKKTLPVVFQGLSWALANTVLTSYIGHMGPDVVAGNALMGLVFTIFTAVGMGFRQAVNVLIGNELGRGNLKLAKKKGNWVFSTSLLMGLISCALTFIVGRLIMLMPMEFSDEAWKYSMFILVAYSLDNLIHAPNNMINGCLFAGGETKYIFKVDTFSGWVILVGIGALFIYVIKAPTVICIFLLLMGEWYTFPFKYARLRSGKWVNNLTKQNAE